MSKKLYLVTMETEIYVMAETKEDARRIARQDGLRDVDEYNMDINAQEIQNKKHGIYADWADAIPYGSEDDKTVKQIVEELK